MADKRRSLNGQQGAIFPAQPMLNSGGDSIYAVEPALHKKTIVEYWFRNCPYCLAEMKQLSILLPGRENELELVSISIDDYAGWKAAVTGSDQRYAFLRNNLPNWKQLLLNFPKDSAGKNTNAKQLVALLQVTGFPTFFVLDQQGVIIATPVSAVAYIRQVYEKENGFLLFIRAQEGSSVAQLLLLLLLTVAAYLVLVRLFANGRWLRIDR